MASSSSTTLNKLPPLQFSRELFADYWTAVVSRVRQDDECDQVYSGIFPHPLISLQQSNQQQILSYNCVLVPEEVLKADPIQPADFLIAAIIVAAKELNVDPPLDQHWDVFKQKWPTYKRAQRKIYATIISTLRVGTSMHYARAVAYGAGTRLMNAIYDDNCRNTTRSLFALFASLFTLKAKPGETFDSFKVRFDLIIGRFANWNPPIILPKALLLFFALRGLPDKLYGPQKHIILAIKNVTLERGFQLLRDAGSDEASVISSTLGSEATQPIPAQDPSTSILTTVPAEVPATPIAAQASVPPPNTRRQKKTREQRMSALCKRDGPCIHHGPKSLHATVECRDPQLLRRKNKSQKPVPVQNVNTTPVPAQHLALPYPQPGFPTMHMYPPAVYHPPVHPYMQPPSTFSPPMMPTQNSHHALLMQVADSTEVDDNSDLEPSTAQPDIVHTDLDFDDLPRLTDRVSSSDDYDSSTESDDSSSDDDASESDDDSFDDDLFKVFAAAELQYLIDCLQDDEETIYHPSPQDESDELPPLVSASSEDNDDSSDSSDSASEEEQDADELPPLVSESSEDNDDSSDSSDNSDSASEEEQDADELPPLVSESSEDNDDSSDSVNEEEQYDAPQPLSHFSLSSYDRSQVFYREARSAPGKRFTHVTEPSNPFDVATISKGLLHVTTAAFTRADTFRMPCVDPPVVPTLIITPTRADDDESPPPPPPPSSEESVVVSSETEDESANVAEDSTATAVPAATASSEFDNSNDLDDATLISLVSEDEGKPQGVRHAPPPPRTATNTPPSVSSPVSDASETLPYDPSEFVSTTLPPALPPPKPRRRKCHNWSQKGTKATRRRLKHVKSEPSAIKPPASLGSPSASSSSAYASPTRASSSAENFVMPPHSPASPITPSRPKCAAEGCTRFTGKRKYGTGYFKHCFDHRHLDHSSPHVYASPASDMSPIVQDITNHNAALTQSTAAREQSLNLEPQVARLRRARCTYAYAQGLHTVLHYPQQFLVTLRGEPAIRDDWSVAPCMILGNAQPARAVKAVLRTVTSPDINPKSMCNHIGCVYNLGDLLARRQRHWDAIKSINKQLGLTEVLLVTHGNPTDVVLDSGAGRHLHNRQSDFSTLRPCPPQTLTGFAGSHARVCQSGTVGNFADVLLMPSAHASVRSVGYALDRRGGSIQFTTTNAVYIAPSGASTEIARRNNNGLYTMIPGAMPPPLPRAPVYISVPTQVRREAIHRLHQCLGHASIERMRYILKTAPQACGSLTTRDLALFTTCAACQVGKCVRAPRPKATATRSTLFAHRLHADTTGVIRPSTQGGFRRALIVVDDASRWIFAVLLQAATKHETCAALRSILQAAASDAHVLRTQILRTDNGTEFLNSCVAELLAQGGIRHERTCPHTSHQNGVAERAIGRLMPLVRTFLAAASARPTLWGEALLAAVHVTNRMPCTANDDNASPYFIRYGRHPQISHLQPWGITAYVRRTNPQTKVIERADTGILVGYGHEVSRQKGWRVYVPHLRRVDTATNVSFDTNLDESVQRRHLSERSVALPEETNDTSEPYVPDAPMTVPTAPLPAAAAPHASSPDSGCPPASAPPLPPPVHPLCSRPTAATPLVPSAVIAEQPARPATRSMTTLPRNSGASWSDVVRKADADIAVTTTIPRPRGRPPSNHEWDETRGQYVPINIVGSAPSANSAWILATMNQELVADHVTPKTPEEALAGPDAAKWQAAMDEELSSLKHCAVWKVVLLSAVSRKCKAIPAKWVFKLKSDGAGNIARYKARLVVCGYRQKFGRDYNQTFAPVAHAASIRLVLALAVHLSLHLRQFDVKTAFLYGVLPENQRVYLQPPKGVPVPRGCVLALYKAMYGLKQAPLLWNQHLHNTLTSLSFKRSHFDPCVYSRRDSGGRYIILAVVVDDILVATSSSALADSFADDLRKTYKITDLGEPRRLVGLNITPVPNGIQLDQCQFVKDVAADFKQSSCKPVQTPIAPGTVPVGASPDLPPGHRYLSLVGSLLWASVTRPDIAVAVSIACSKSAKPTKADLAAAIRILRYLLHTPSVKLTFCKSAAPAIFVFCDSAWANAPKARSRFGYIVCIHGCPVMWESKLTTMVCLSTAEAEYIAAVHASKSALWLARLLCELRYLPVPPILLLEDNQACINMAMNPVVSARNRHFAMRMWWLRDQVEQNNIVMKYLPTQSQLADIFTKVLAAPRFLELRNHLMSGNGPNALQRSHIVSKPGGGVSKDTSATPGTDTRNNM